MSNTLEPKLALVNSWSIKSELRAIWVVNGQSGMKPILKKRVKNELD